jgi:hypothetical protein
LHPARHRRRAALCICSCLAQPHRRLPTEYRRATSWPAADVDAIAIPPRKGAGAQATSDTERARPSTCSAWLPQRPWLRRRETSVVAAIAKNAIDFTLPPPVLFSEGCAIMDDDNALRADAPLCPTRKNPMELGRVKVDGYPYVPSFECWPCLEVFTEADKSR